MASIAFCVANPAGLHAQRDTPFKTRMESTLGHTVTLVDDNDIATYDFSDFDAVVVSRSITSGNAAALKATAKPVLTLNGYNFDEFALGTGQGSQTNVQINIVDNTHYITENESTGLLTIYNATDNVDMITGWSQDVNDLAQHYNQSTHAAILEIDKDETLIDESTATERRVFFGGEEGDQLTADGWDLFDRSLGWCLYEDAAAESGSADLSANLTVRNKAQSDLSCNVTIQNKAQFDLSANVTIRNQGQYDLSASATIQNKGSYDLSANVTIQNKSQSDLSANVTIRNKSHADLSANFTISSVQDGQADLSSNVTIQNKGTAELSANVFIGTGMGGYIKLADAIVHKIVVDSQVHTIKVSSEPL